MTIFKSTQAIVRKRIVIKLGGSTLEGLNKAFFSNFKALQLEGYEIIVTHGGGPAINRELEKRNISSHKIDGIRVTNEEAMEIVQSTLIGLVNPSLVHELNQEGIHAIGLNGFDSNLIQCDFYDFETYGYVGKIKEIDTSVIDVLTANNIVPVISCVGVSKTGEALNINGDTVASEIALAVGAERLLLVTDVSGISIGGVYQKEVTPDQIYEWIDKGEITGGMIPKVEGAIHVLNAGIPKVEIVDDGLSGTTILNRELVK